MAAPAISPVDKNAFNEIKMWAPQMGEHALFLNLMLNDDALKKQGMDIFLKFKAFTCNLSMDNWKNVRPLLAELKAYKQEVLSRLLKGEWLGSVFPRFVRHILDELIYFEKKLDGQKMTVEDEVKFWNRINSEHAAFAAHLLDPDEMVLIKAAQSTSEKIAGLPISQIVLALESGVALDKFSEHLEQAVKEHKVLSIIQPDLISHVVREGKRGNQTMEAAAKGFSAHHIEPPAVRTVSFQHCNEDIKQSTLSNAPSESVFQQPSFQQPSFPPYSPAYSPTSAGRQKTSFK